MTCVQLRVYTTYSQWQIYYYLADISEKAEKKQVTKFAIKYNCQRQWHLLLVLVRLTADDNDCVFSFVFSPSSEHRCVKTARLAGSYFADHNAAESLAEASRSTDITMCSPTT